MTKRKDIVDQMLKNPKGDWRLEQLVTVAESVGLTVRNTGGSHHTFASPHVQQIQTVPFKRPVKPLYVKAFCRLVKNHLAAMEEE